jgi:hypothetical protein
LEDPEIERQRRLDYLKKQKEHYEATRSRNWRDYLQIYEELDQKYESERHAMAREQLKLSILALKWTAAARLAAAAVDEDFVVYEDGTATEAPQPEEVVEVETLRVRKREERMAMFERYGGFYR